MARQGEERKLIYAMVARGTTVMAEQTVYEGNFGDIAAQCLQRLPARDDRFTCDGHTFTFHINQGYAYFVVATEATRHQIPLAFLEMIKEDFNKRYAGGKAATATANSLTKDFGPRLKEQMQYCMDHPEELTRLSEVIMMEKIEKMFERGGYCTLGTSTGQLHEQANDFRQEGTRKRRKMWFDMNVKLIILSIVAALILIIVLSICVGHKCS